MKNLLINRALAAKKKKIFTLLLAVAASVGTMFAVTIDGLNYNLNDESQTAEVADNYGIGGEIIIPSNVTYNSVSYSVTSIGYEAFWACTGLTSVTIPNSVTSIGDYAFSSCRGLTSVTIPNSVTSIGEFAFSGCSGLTSVTIPNSVTSIGRLAFADCTGLTSVTIPNSVTSIGNDAFYGCNSLTSPVYNTHVFAYMPTSYSGAYTIPDGIESIAYAAFADCTGLTSVTIPNSVTSIAGGAFYNCTGLTSVTIPNSVTSIGENAFCRCSGLTSVTIPNSVTSIGENAFDGCTSLTSINVESDNPNYCSVNGVLFNKNLTTLISYPCGKQGAYTIPNSVTSIGSSAFYNCTGLTSVTIPNSVTNIGNYAFQYCSGLTSVTIGNSVTSIGYGAFIDCTGLTSVTIPNSVTSIGDDAFNKCSGLTSVTIGNSVTSIGSSAFRGCTGLTSVTCFATTPPQLDSYVFKAVDKSIPLYVPAGSISAYKSADQWKDFTNILPIGAQPADVTTTTVTPSETTADIAWPQVTGAATYTIEIKKNGELICTLTFNAQGQLISIAFAAPSRNNAPQQAQAAGFAFTVTSLDSGTTYSYTMTAKDNNGNVLKTESGTFTTTGESQGIEDVQGNNVQCTKVVRNGQIFILRGDKTYTTDGRLVR